MDRQLRVFGSTPPIVVDHDAVDPTLLTLKGMITPWWILAAAWLGAGMLLGLLGHPVMGGVQAGVGLVLDTAIQGRLRARLAERRRGLVRDIGLELGVMIFLRFTVAVSGALFEVSVDPTIASVSVLVLLQAWFLCVAVVRFGHAPRLMACALAPVLAALWLGLAPRAPGHGEAAILGALILLTCVVVFIAREVSVLCWTWISATRRNIELQHELTQARDEALAERDQAAAAREDAARANAAKSDFLAVMSHEIRTPLNGVLGMAQVIAQGPLEAEQRERLDILRRSGDDLLTVLNDILDLSKIEAGRLELDEGEFDLAGLLGEVHAGFKGVAEAKGLTLTLDVSAAGGRVRGDAGRLRQVLANLLSNALKFTHEGEVRLAAAHARGHLTVQVVDTGVGMGPETLARLFEPYAQADASTARTFGGTGLGLSIARQLAELMGGSIEATSHPGRGSNFVVSLPLAAARPARTAPKTAKAAPAPPPQEAPIAPSAPAGPRVLAADDHPVNRLVLGALLEPMGVQLVTVENGREAVDAFAAGAWDLVLMDIQMPVMDGVAAVHAIRELEAAEGRAHTPIVALTAHSMPQHIAEYRQAGMDGHLAKPIEAAALYAVLESVLTGAAPTATETVRTAA